MGQFTPFTAAGTIDPFVWTKYRNFGAESGTRWHTRYRSYAGDAIEWQKAVYDRAQALDAERSFGRIVDLGCGSGEKSARRFGEDGRLLQADRNDYREADVQDAQIPFLNVSLDHWDDMDELLAQIDPDQPCLVICSDVIEHLHDPRPLMYFLRRILLLNRANAAILSTPDHARIEGGAPGALPSNEEHVRQWSAFAFGAQLRSLGFRVDAFGVVPMHDYDTLQCTLFAQLSCDAAFNEAFLDRASLPRTSRRVLVTSEHMHTGRGGGIGTYAAESEAVLSDRTITLFHGQNGVRTETARERNRQWMHVAIATCPPSQSPDLADGPETGQKILDTVKTLLVLYPDLAWIEFQDYLGRAVSIPQAKRAGLLPSRLATVCYCHGNHHYLEVNHGHFFFDHDTHSREKQCIELADLTLIPSEYLSGLYSRAGIRPRKEVRLPYPYDLDRKTVAFSDYNRIRNILFFGKRTRGKGYHLFAEAINDLAEQGALEDIETITLAGVGEDTAEFHPSLAKKIKYQVFPNNTLRNALYAARCDTLAVLPYLGDNFPYSVHDLVDAGVETIFARAGGLPEVYAGCDPDGHFTFEPNAAALGRKIGDAIKQSGITRHGRVHVFREAFAALQRQRNEDFAGTDFVSLAAPSKTVSTTDFPAYDVIITYHNEEARYLQDALDGLAGQCHQPSKVVVIDDSSRPERRDEIAAVLDAETRLRATLVSAPQNLGLAGARNLGLEQVESPFFISHDVDNVLRSDAVEKFLTALARDPEIAVATCHSMMFSDGEDWMNRWDILGTYAPTGPDLGELEANTFGDALAMYRRSSVEAVGGWRITKGREPLEDFQLFYQLTCSGHRIAVVNEPIAFYRVRAGSMLRTYDRFGGYMRLADTLTEKLGRDGLAIVRHSVEAVSLRSELSKREAENAILEQALAAAKGQGDTPDTSESRDHDTAVLIKLLMANLPKRMRDETAIMGWATQKRSWRTFAWRHPFPIRRWQTVRRLQRAARKLGLR